jgi:23S rRNA pseudouridine1911/1915/1917 synthase
VADASNQGFAYREQIGSPGHGRAVLDYLSARYRHSSASQWEDHIRAGRVRVDGRAVRPADRLHAGQHLVWHRPPWREPDAPRGFAVLAVDADVLAVAKPAGLASIPGGGFLVNTLSSCVRERYPDATAVHRLGRGTSGVMLFARSDVARRRLARDFRVGEVERVYRARVGGRLERAEISITTPIGPVPHRILGTVHAASPGGRPSRSAVRLLESDGRTSLVEVTIATGRPHQIRIHLAAAGHPLSGDLLYAPGGVPRADTDVLPGDGGYLLHALRLGFRHPATGAAQVVECAPPAALMCG